MSRILTLDIDIDAFEEKYKRIKDELLQYSNKINIYLDTNIFSRAVDGNIKAPEASALRRIMTKSNLSLYTSEKTRQELSNHPKKPENDYLQFIINLLPVISEENFIEMYEATIGSSPIGTTTIGGGGVKKIDPLFTQLASIFDNDDAIQVFQAIKSNADYFLTLDERTILKRRIEFNKLGFNTKIVSPTNLVNILFAVDDNII